VAVTQLFRLNTSLQAEEHVDTAQLSMIEMLASNAAPTHKLRHVGKPLGATFLGICKLCCPSDAKAPSDFISGTNLKSPSNPDPPPGLPQIFRKPTFHHPWQVPSVTRQHCLGVDCDFRTNCVESGRCCGGRTECLREEIITTQQPHRKLDRLSEIATWSNRVDLLVTDNA